MNQSVFIVLILTGLNDLYLSYGQYSVIGIAIYLGYLYLTYGTDKKFIYL